MLKHFSVAAPMLPALPLLIVLDLIARAPAVLVAKRNVILAFLPWRRGEASAGKAQ
jgi:hypothetical protein